MNKFQDGMKLTPLSKWGTHWKAPAGKVDPSVDMKTAPAIQVENMTGKQFFKYASRLMKLHPPKATDFSQVARLKHIGIVPGEELNYGKDGSLDLYFQPTSPGKDTEVNWLPTPKQGTWNLTLRAYAPKPEIANGTWNPPAIKKK